MNPEEFLQKQKEQNRKRKKLAITICIAVCMLWIPIAIFLYKPTTLFEKGTQQDTVDHI